MIYNGDCKILIKDLSDNSVDAVVTDPPYGLTDKNSGFHRGKANQFTRTAKGGFMGKQWDGSGIEYSVDFWREVLRVLKPGGHLLAFGGSRTYHRLACAIEDAGFEIRDQIMWIYGSGFPKALDVSKAIDKMKGVEREVSGTYKTPDGRDYTLEKSCQNGYNKTDLSMGKEKGVERRNITLPATPEANYWEGWKSALKPAHEPICVARKPLDGTIAENCLKWGVGALNIDGSRIETNEDLSIQRNGDKKLDTQNQGWGFKAVSRGTQGRYPANVILDEVAGVMLDEQSGVSKSTGHFPKKVNMKGHTLYEGGFEDFEQTERHLKDTQTGASRFFYCAKASRNERNAGLEGMEKKERRTLGNGLTGISGDRTGNGTSKPIEMGSNKMQNHHPTVKPIKLMEYLINLVSREGQTVLDPFAGSGTTLIACDNLNRIAIGFEQEKEYIEIAEKRREYWRKVQAEVRSEKESVLELFKT